jgi:uncharacterized membrane protein YkvA (DUF1232 family)
MHLPPEGAVLVVLLLLHHQCLPSGLSPCDLVAVTGYIDDVYELSMLTARATDAAMMCKAGSLKHAGHLLLGD